ncbi:MAG: hypothetical protein CL916_11110 [Deltaproteobacteria bacterium]|nr:hypothetical protein [Deltaproteobacteria bacterium]
MIFFAILIILGCRSPIEDTSFQSTDRIYVIDEITFARRTDEGVWGFDIDEHISQESDATGCHHPDGIDPLGNEGIDNAMSGLVPALELTEAAAIEPLIDEAIRNGNLVLLFEYDDSTLSMYKGIGAPMVGTDGKLLDGQSFVVEEQALQVVSLQEDFNTWIGFPFALMISLSIMGNDINFDMSQGGIRIEEQEDGSVIGSFGGAIPLSSLLVIANDDQVGPNELFVGLIESAADLFPDDEGQCQYLSVAFSFHAIPAFFIE